MTISCNNASRDYADWSISASKKDNEQKTSWSECSFKHDEFTTENQMQFQTLWIRERILHQMWSSTLSSHVFCKVFKCDVSLAHGRVHDVKKHFGNQWHKKTNLCQFEQNIQRWLLKDEMVLAIDSLLPVLTRTVNIWNNANDAEEGSHYSFFGFGGRRHLHLTSPVSLSWAGWPSVFWWGKLVDYMRSRHAWRIQRW